MSVNFRPYGAQYDHATRTSTIFDRCFRPIAKMAGRFPRVDYGGAVACSTDEPRCYSGERTFFHRDDNARVCDPAVRRRLSELARSCPAARRRAFAQGQTGGRGRAACRPDRADLRLKKKTRRGFRTGRV